MVSHTQCMYMTWLVSSSTPGIMETEVTIQHELSLSSTMSSSSLTELIRDSPSTHWRESMSEMFRVTICHAADDSILVANIAAYPELYRVNLTTGDVEWRLNTGSGDVGVFMCRKDFPLITRLNYSTEIKIWTMNINTGKKASAPWHTPTNLMTRNCLLFWDTRIMIWIPFHFVVSTENIAPFHVWSSILSYENWCYFIHKNLIS